MTINIEMGFTSEFGAAFAKIDEPDERSAKRPYEPTPLFPQLARERQSLIRNQMQDILENRRPDYIRDELYDFIEIMYMSREANRNVRNAESYGEKLFEEGSIESIELIEAIQGMKEGSASTSELIAVAQCLGMASIELAKLTHIYGYRLEYIDDMRQDIHEAIRLSDGEVFYGDDVKESYTLIGSDTGVTGLQQPSFGLAMRRKRLVGAVDGFNVYERSSFVVNIDKDSDTKISSRLRGFVKNYEFNGGNEKEVNGKPLWSYGILRDSTLIDEVRECISSNDVVSVIPISTTVYAHSSEIEQIQQLRDEEQRRLSREQFEKQAPTAAIRIKKLHE